MSRIRPFIVYLLTIIGLMLSGYQHLDFAARGIRNFDLGDLLNAWPIFSLLAAVLLFALSIIFVILRRSKLAHKTAGYAIVFGWAYYVISFCALCSLTSLVMFIEPETYLFFLPSVMLLITTADSIYLAR
jgi:hypothetical protein